MLPMVPPMIAALWLFREGADDVGDVTDDVDVAEVDIGKGNEDVEVISMLEVSVWEESG